MQKFLRDQLNISRRAAEDLIRNGKVFVNGSKVTLGMKFDPLTDVVTLEDGKTVSYKEKVNTYVMFNKPAGFMTTKYDPHADKTIYDILPKTFETLFPVGRLDKDTEGLLLLTNDGDFSYKLTHPKFEIAKEYYVILDKELEDLDIDRIKQGIKSEEITSVPAKVEIIKTDGGRTHLKIIITEGQKREIKRIFMVLGYKVNYLKRLKIGSLELGSLLSGEYKVLLPDIAYLALS